MWLWVLALGGLSVAFRVVRLFAPDHVIQGMEATDGLRRAGMGALTAIIIGSLMSAPDSTHPPPGLVIGIGVAAVLAWRGGSMIAVVLGGGACYAAVTVLEQIRSLAFAPRPFPAMKRRYPCAP